MSETERGQQDTVRWVLSLLVRRRWWILLPACCIAILSALALPYIPKRYTADASLVVVQQQVSPLYVTPTTTLTPSDAVKRLTREVLSRPRLLRIIEDLGLYPGVQRTDLLADKMRDSIGVDAFDPNGMDYSTFKLSFSANSPQLAQAVTSRLASLFIEENLRAQGEQAETTASFLNSQVAEAKRKLDEQEAQLKAFKLKNLGQLPQEEGSNLAAVTALRAQLQNTLDNLSRARRQRDSLESVLSDDLTSLAAERSKLLKSFTAQHPAVVAKDREIARFRALLDRLRGAAGAERVPAASSSSEDIAFTQLQTQIETNAAEIGSLTNDQKNLEANIAKYQKRLNLTPISEAQLAAILRDRDQYSQDYIKLLNQQQQSQMTANLEERQQGQHFRLVDPASFPLAPSKPDPRKILLGGLAGGIVLGLALALLMDMSKPCFHFEKELAQTCSLPLVVAVPLMLTPFEMRRRRWRVAFEWLAASVMLLLVTLVEAHTYFGRLPFLKS